MPEKVKSSLIERAKELVKFFEIDLTIKIFGIPIINYHFPSKKNSL